MRVNLRAAASCSGMPLLLSATPVPTGSGTNQQPTSYVSFSSSITSSAWSGRQLNLLPKNPGAARSVPSSPVAKPANSTFAGPRRNGAEAMDEQEPKPEKKRASKKKAARKQKKPVTPGGGRRPFPNVTL